MTESKGYATVSEDDGVNYRVIAATMENLGFKMNHSSARNHVLRAMRKFAAAFVEEWDVSADEEEIEQIARSPFFQDGIGEVLRNISSSNHQ